MENINIRPGNPSDGERVAEMAAALSAHEGEPPPPFSAETFRRFGFGEERRFESLVAEIMGGSAQGEDRGGELAGYVLFSNLFHVGLGAPGLHMIDLFVEPRFRRLGLGRRMLAALARICREREATWITWQCLPSNAEAMAFYEDIGGRRFNAANFELAGPNLVRLAT